jgi:plasmid stabilization system protein ParE
MTVEWTDEALDHLADIYVATPTPGERDAIARCVERINRQLAADPGTVGESRGPGRRVWFAHPLMVAFDLPPGGGVVINQVTRLKGDPQDD